MGKNNKNKIIPKNTETIIKQDKTIIENIENPAVKFSIEYQNLECINKEHYNALVEENKDLKAQLKQITNDYLTELKNKDNTIEELNLYSPEQNNDYSPKENLFCSESKTVKAFYPNDAPGHQFMIIAVKRENEELKKELDKVKNDISFIKDKMAKREINELFNKFKRAIQDINRIKELEKNIKDKRISQKLKELRSDRNITAHYLYDDDDEEINNYKIYLLFKKLINLNVDIKNKFNKNYPNLIENVIKYISHEIKEVSEYDIISEDMKENINEWWED